MKNNDIQTAGRSQRPRKQLNGKHQARVRCCDKPAASGKRHWEYPLAALPAIAGFTRLFKFSDNAGHDVDVHRNGAGQLILDESMGQTEVGKGSGIYARIRQRRFTTTDALCDLFLSLLTPEDYTALKTSICQRQVETCADPSKGGKGASSDTEDHIVRVPFSATEARRLQRVAKKLGTTEETILLNAIDTMLDNIELQPENANILTQGRQDATRLPALK